MEAAALGAGHEVLARAVVAVLHDIALAAADGDAGEDRDKEERKRSEDGASEKDLVGAEVFFDKGFHAGVYSLKKRGAGAPL